MRHGNNFRQQIAPAQTIRDAMPGDTRLVKRDDAAAAQAKRCRTIFFCGGNQRFGFNLGFVAFAQIEQQHAMRAAMPWT